jgi:hypothetical protein
MLIVVCTHLYKYTDGQEALSIKFKSFFAKKTPADFWKIRIVVNPSEVKCVTRVAANKHAGPRGTVAFGTGMALHDWQHCKDDCWISGVENVTNRIAVFFVP